MAEARQEEISAEDVSDALRINPFLAHKVKLVIIEVLKKRLVNVLLKEFCSAS